MVSELGRRAKSLESLQVGLMIEHGERAGLQKAGTALGGGACVPKEPNGVALAPVSFYQSGTYGVCHDLATQERQSGGKRPVSLILRSRLMANTR